ncbi:hypothetical protein IWX90DRAFT_509795 [Phyllosticta citrichinensis]|uniref:BTB domain-containing protein n=1 Tax=Phyllosticta citrichinensis TaxID=1130410 RepID=A0ABR1Y4V4_9PEZI
MEHREALAELQAQGHLRDYLENGVHSDFEIHDGQGNVWSVHKIILCLQSEFFEHMLNPAHNFIELQTGIVTLQDEYPNAIDALITYFYSLDYSDECMDEDHGKPLLHLFVYSAGAKYLVLGLKDLAKQRFIDSLDSFTLDEVYFPWLVEEIYASTINSDRGLRDVIVQLTKDRIHEVTNLVGFEELLERSAQFSRDLGISSADELHRIKSLPRYTCQPCGATMYVDFPLEGAEEFYCPNCGDIQDSEMWQAHRVTLAPHAPLKEYTCRNCMNIVRLELCPGGPLRETVCSICGVRSKNEDWDEYEHIIEDEEQ